MGIEIRTGIVDEEFDAFRRTLGYAFNFDPSDDERENFAKRLEFDRAVAAFDDGVMVGTGGAFSLRMTVPGGAAPVPTGGTTVVAVRPTHRRRGLLRAMMDAHLADVAQREEPLAALWASDSGIYGRFGYGPATYRHEVEIDKGHVQFLDDPPPGRVDLLPEEDALPLLRQVYDAEAPGRAGMFGRDEDWWKNVILHDPEAWRDGYSGRRYAVYREDGVPQGYVLYRSKEKWERGHGAGATRVAELVARTHEARSGLWRFLCSFDLVTDLKHWNVPVDDELPWLVANPRRVHRTLLDGVWLRVLDVPAALEARRYRTAGRLVFELTDEAFPAAAGTYELEGGPDGAQCKPTDAEPELRLDAMALGALYLGGNRAGTLASAGHLHAAPEAVRTTDLMFGWHRAPWCQEVF